ncbi:hypothetical protein YPPY61_1282, partial [Yersinia pestis PY-61]
MFQTEHLSAT